MKIRPFARNTGHKPDKVLDDAGLGADEMKFISLKFISLKFIFLSYAPWETILEQPLLGCAGPQGNRGQAG